MLTYKALWKRICKFFGFKSVSDGDTNGNTTGKEYAVRRSILTIVESKEPLHFILREDLSGIIQMDGIELIYPEHQNLLSF